MPEGPFAGVVRSKGQLWLANCNAVQIDFHSAGRQVSLGSGMPFLAAMPRKYWDANSWKQYLEYAQQNKLHVYLLLYCKCIHVTWRRWETISIYILYV